MMQRGGNRSRHGESVEREKEGRIEEEGPHMETQH
jgi:hypothetical protein